jgi:hypothetical protein
VSVNVLPGGAGIADIFRPDLGLLGDETLQ